jgi:hypothetical protein
MIDILVFGGGMVCLDIINYLKDVSKFTRKKINIVGVVEPKKIDKKNTKKIYGKKIRHYLNLKNINFDKKKTFSIITSGDPFIREKCRLEIKKKGLKLFTLIHPTSYVHDSAVIGEGCILAPFSLIGSKTKLEENIFVNIYSSTGHHCFIGKSSVMSPYSTLNGGGHSGKMSFLGTNSVITSQAKLGNYCKLGAGSVLYKKTNNNCLVTGNPAESILKYNKKR